MMQHGSTENIYGSLHLRIYKNTYNSLYLWMEGILLNVTILNLYLLARYSFRLEEVTLVTANQRHIFKIGGSTSIIRLL